MTKTVFFIRHAKSSWSNPSLNDHERPLNQRGMRDAPFMAQLLRAQVKELDKIASSPAKRAFKTARHFAEAFQIDSENILLEPAIYMADFDTLIEIIRGFKSSWNTVLIFGHNPTFTDTVNRFTKNYIENVPTCGIVEVQAQINDWNLFGKEENTSVMNFQYPKQYFT